MLKIVFFCQNCPIEVLNNCMFSLLSTAVNYFLHCVPKYSNSFSRKLELCTLDGCGSVVSSEGLLLKNFSKFINSRSDIGSAA